MALRALRLPALSRDHHCTRQDAPSDGDARHRLQVSKTACGRIACKRVSRSVLRQQLRQKGVNQEIIEEALLVVSDADELRMATELVERKARAMSRLEPEVRKRRLFGLLARKGYNTSIALRVIQDLEAADFNGAEVMSDLS